MKTIIKTILKGNHRSGWLPIFYFNDTIIFTIECKSLLNYNLPKKYQKDTQKIFGISDSYNHHKHSIRIGWRSLNNNKIEFLLYYYISGKHYTKSLGIHNSKDIKNKSLNGKIVISKNFYYITFNNLYYSIPRISNWINCRYLLFPYFGDKSKPNTEAPRDLIFKIKYGYGEIISKKLFENQSMLINNNGLLVYGR